VWLGRPSRRGAVRCVAGGHDVRPLDCVGGGAVLWWCVARDGARRVWVAMVCGCAAGSTGARHGVACGGSTCGGAVVWPAGLAEVRWCAASRRGAVRCVAGGALTCGPLDVGVAQCVVVRGARRPVDVRWARCVGAGWLDVRVGARPLNVARHKGGCDGAGLSAWGGAGWLDVQVARCVAVGV